VLHAVLQSRACIQYTSSMSSQPSISRGSDATCAEMHGLGQSFFVTRGTHDHLSARHLAYLP